jgi:hypothetical protein
VKESVAASPSDPSETIPVHPFASIHRAWRIMNP